MSTRRRRTTGGGVRGRFTGGLVLLTVGFGFALGAWLASLDEEATISLALFGLLGVAIFVVGTYLAVQGAAKVDR